MLSISSGKGNKPSSLMLVLATIVVASLIFIASRLSSIKTRQEALTAMRNGALSGGVSQDQLPGNVLPATDSRIYADYFINMP